MTITVEGPDIMVVVCDEPLPPRVVADYSDAHIAPLVEVRLRRVRDEQQLADVATRLRQIADDLETLHAQYLQQREMRAADIQSTAMQLLTTLQEIDMPSGDKAEVVSAFGEAAAMSLPRRL